MSPKTEEHMKIDKHMKAHGIKHMERCLASLFTREMQIQAAVQYHLTPIRMETIRRKENNRLWQEFGETGILCAVGENVRCWNHYEK